MDFRQVLRNAKAAQKAVESATVSLHCYQEGMRRLSQVRDLEWPPADAGCVTQGGTSSGRQEVHLALT